MFLQLCILGHQASEWLDNHFIHTLAPVGARLLEHTRVL